MQCHRLLAATAALVLTALSSFAVQSAGAGPTTVSATTVAPNALLTIDQNRTTVVDRIMATWGDALVISGAGLTREQLQMLLTGMRSDYLLAASLTGSLEGLRTVIANGITANAPTNPTLIQTKALGDAADDLVYTPVTPCRILDTRTFGGVFASGGETRSYHAYLTSGTFAAQGGTASNCGIPANPAAAALNIVTVGGGSFLTAWPFGAPQPLASTLNPAPGMILANGALVPLCQPSCANQFSIFTFGAHVIIDIVGYFRAPSAIALTGNLTVAGNVGIGTNPVNGRLEVAATTGTGIAGTSPDWVGVVGASATFEGVRGESSSSGAAGVAGYSKSGTGIGTYGSSSGGNGIYGTSTSGTGVYGTTAAPYSYTNAGVWGTATGSGGIGVHGQASVGNAWAVYGESASPGGVGVYASNSGGGRALYVDGQASQSLPFGGLVKAMIQVYYTGTIIRCFNSTTGSTTVPCGFSVSHPVEGNYTVNFGFQVDNRFTLHQTLAETYPATYPCQSYIANYATTSLTLGTVCHWDGSGLGSNLNGPLVPWSKGFFMLVF